MLQPLPAINVATHLAGALGGDLGKALYLLGTYESAVIGLTLMLQEVFKAEEKVETRKQQRSALQQSLSAAKPKEPSAEAVAFQSFIAPPEPEAPPVAPSGDGAALSKVIQSSYRNK